MEFLKLSNVNLVHSEHDHFLKIRTKLMEKARFGPKTR